MGKIKLENANESVEQIHSTSEEKTYEERLKFVNKISKPMASKKLTKKLYKCAKKACKAKTSNRGVKDMLKHIKKGEKGIVVLAADIEPIEVMCHLPVVCEDMEIPYCYVPSKQDLGHATGGQNPTCCIFIKHHDSYEEAYNECKSEMKKMTY